MLTAAGPPEPFIDGYGLPFRPDLHDLYVRAGITVNTRVTVPRPPVEPVWKERPAGFRVCPALYEDKDCEQFPA